MIETAVLNKNQPDADIYKSLLPVFENVITSGEPVISVLANVTAVIKEAFDKVSWAGFYLFKNDTLYLGPFQGKIACTIIPACKGVCGLAAVKKETIIVNDVTKFEGHITCDSASQSEIVVPIVSNGIVYGVLDLDSTRLAAFNDDDKYHIGKIVDIIIAKIDLENLKNIII